MKIYIASSWKNEKPTMVLAEILRSDGHEVDCFCDDANGRYVFHFSEIGNLAELDAITLLQDQRAQRAFQEDKKWLDWCEAIVMLMPCGNSAHLEGGYAKGQGKKLYMFGPFDKGEFDVMYGFANGLFKIEQLQILREELSNG